MPVVKKRQGQFIDVPDNLCVGITMESTQKGAINEDESEEELKPNPYTREDFYAEDNETNILMDESGNNIKAATLPKLISKFTTENASRCHPVGAINVHRSCSA